jgi:hypothetical protein
MARPQCDTPLVYHGGIIGLPLFGCEVLRIILGIGKEGLDD